jgi:hypothetical protein
MSTIDPLHLLDQADRLISPPGGGAPRQADLRRAISNAYYAVFHAVVAEAADTFVGRTHRVTAPYSLAYRSIDHRSLRLLCEDVAKASLPKRYLNYAPKGGFGPDLIALATAIVDLQEKRHLADYDPRFRAALSDAKLAVATSRAALARLKKAGRALRKTFLALLAFSPR